MANWAYLENNEVVELYHDIPQNWRNISNFFALESDLKTLRDLGWYPVENTTKPLLDNQEYGDTYYKLNQKRNVVIENTEIKNKNPKDDDTLFQEHKQYFMNELRSRRNDLLNESDWTQLPDIQNIKSEEWKNAWLEYRQQLRNLPEIYDQNYDMTFKIQNIIFPNKP